MTLTEAKLQGLGMSDREILFFSNGVTAVFHDEQQQPELQQSWMELFAEFLESHGQDPARYRVTLPNAKQARYVRTADGWSWRFE